MSKYKWFWEVVWQDVKGNVHSLYSLQGFGTSDEALTVYQASCENINKRLKELGAKLILNEAIVLKNGDQLY